MAFGPVLRFIPLPIPDNPESDTLWDSSIAEADEKYKASYHNIITQNCHDHVDECLQRYQESARRQEGGEDERLPAKRRGNVYYAFWMFFFGKYTGMYAFYWHWMPFLTIIIIIGLLCWFIDV